MLPAVFFWGSVGVLFEDAVEGTLIGKAALVRNFKNAARGLPQKIFCVLDAKRVQIRQKRALQVLREDAGEMACADSKALTDGA